MEAIRVLLVDDEVDFTEALGQRLEARGFAVTTAPSGDEALEKVDDEDFDVVVLDLFMPGRDGLETLREIKSRKPLTEVIMLSGNGTEETAIEGMRNGAFDFLTKPPDITDLVEKIVGAHAKKAKHLARIAKALGAGRGKSQVVVEEVAPAKTLEAEQPAASQPAAAGPVAGIGHQGRLLVFGRETEFSDALIEYALEMAERLSYEVVAVNAAGFSKQSLSSFPLAREKVFRGFRTVSERNGARFREAAEKKGVAFSHAVHFSGPDEATQEIRQTLGEVDFVLSEPVDEEIDPGVGPKILVSSPA